MAQLADDGAYEGRKGSLVVTCFLIQHPSRGWLLWETGLPDLVRWFPWGLTEQEVTLHLRRHLLDHLKDIGLQPDDITYVGMSHLHFDHTGNAHEFPHSVWLIPEEEVTWALQPKTPIGVYLPSLELLNKVKRVDAVDGYDVFGDGSVKVISTPGHTPDHLSLLVNLSKYGPVILAGDLWHLEESRKRRAVPTYNVDRKETLESMDRIESIASSRRAQIILGHDAGDIARLPAFPGYLE